MPECGGPSPNLVIVDDLEQSPAQAPDLLRGKALQPERIHFRDEGQELGFESLAAAGETDVNLAAIR